jgi:tRNA A-37 threonylcarbamoyl transferase component Bud32
MNYHNIDQTFSYLELKNIAKNMCIKISRSKRSLIQDVLKAFKEYEKYKRDKIDRYTKIVQIGNKGKEGLTYLVKTSDNREYAMKTFRKSKSSDRLRKEADFQKMAADVGIAPNVVNIDTVSKYIVMEKLDKHLIEYIHKNGELSKTHQKQIIIIYKKLDSIGVFHGDANLMNLMVKGKKVFIIDFGMSKEITTYLVKKLGTKTPNVHIMTLGIILKMKSLDLPKQSYEILVKYLTEDQRSQFKI